MKCKSKQTPPLAGEGRCRKATEGSGKRHHGSPAKSGGINLKSHPAVKFTIDLLSYILFVLVLSCSFLKKERKTPAHGRTSRSLLLLVNCQRQYNSSVPRLSLQAFLPSAGCCGSHFVRHLEKYNCRTTFGRSSHNGLLPTGLSAVLLTVPFLQDYLCYDMFHEL